MDCGGEKMGSALKEKLKSLCCSNGWCYGVFWRFDQRNPMLLVVEDAYYEEEMKALVTNMLDKVHMLGEGIVGRAAFTGKDQWILSDANSGGWKSAGSDGTQEIFEDDSEVQPQFSYGIKTIAVISVESQGVIQLGSTREILERQGFSDETKGLFKGVTSKANSPSSLNYENYDLDEWFDSLCSGNITPMLGSMNSNELMEIAYPSMNHTQSSSFTSDVQEGRLSPLCMESSHPMNNSINMSVSQAPCISTQSNEGSVLTSIESQFTSDFIIQDSSHVLSTNSSTPAFSGNTNQNFQADSTFISWHLNSGTDASRGEHSQKEAGTQRFQRGFKPDDLIAELSNPNLMDNIFEWLAPSPEQSISEMATIINESPVQSGRVMSESSGLIGDLLLDLPFKQSAHLVESSITDMHACQDKRTPVISNSVENNLFESLGVELSCGQGGNCLEDLIRPALGGVPMPAINTGVSECISELDVGSTAASRKGLFSELGIEELLDSVSNSNSAIRSSVDDQLTTSKRRKMEHSQGQFAKVSCTGGSMRMQHVHTPDEKVDLFSKKESNLKSQVSLWIDDSYSANNGIAGITKSKKPEEPAKATRKRARPGESTRPRPRDRQQIQDRIKELKEIIPDGGKCSIDALLDRTIKHMLFLQSVTKYADKLKQADEPKLISQESRLLMKDKKKGGGGITWALEVADETAVCPIVVEDLYPPGLMLVEMLCEDRGFFLEIADVIKGFGLNIIKGVMETREDKIWARFIVEAKVRITRAEILWSLVELLNRMGTNGADPTNQPSNAVNDGGVPELNSYQPSSLPCPISLTGTGQ
ncbi:hypothetical protein Tsubulata_001115 [Turnera subulata]|uniref:BHLH domain-containing protein n=1 Tax=Turnera subulata TaxID=218843 RepID=A0A9Q0FZS4_9ROSI|nr:hypothetical protein Tsubulata_001115 [Turnera subulata]